MILGLDVSTSVTGLAVLNKNGELVHIEHIDLKKIKDIYQKAMKIEDTLVSLYSKYQITQIFIEQPFTFFNSGGSSAKTMATLQKFNGIVSWICHHEFTLTPQHIMAGEARKLVGLKVPRGTKAKSVVMQHCIDNEKMFEVEYTRFGNIKQHYYDIADAIVISKAGYYLLQEKTKDV